MRLLVADTGAALADHVAVADAPFSRLRGWLGRSSAEVGHALVLTPCQAVHTWFMQFAIDVVFVTSDWRIVRIVCDLPPFCHAAGGRGAVSAIEFRAGTVTPAGLRPGDRLVLTA